MDLYPLLILAHILGGIAFVSAVGLEVLVVTRLRRATTTEQARMWLSLLEAQARVAPAGMGAALITGIWMMIVRWGPLPWMTVALGGLAVLVAVGLTITRRAMTAVHEALAGAGDRPPPAFRAAVSSGALALSLQTRAFITLAIVALMALKPGLGWSLTLMGAAIATGVATAAAPGRRRDAVTT